MADNVVVTIDLGRKCVECHKAGATPSGLCLRCATKAMSQLAKMKTPEGRAIQARFAGQLKQLREKK